MGENSFTSGYESRAKGKYSQALGYQAIARGDYSTAIGKKAMASNINAFAFGDSASAKGKNSYAFGNYSTASGDQSFAFGSWDQEQAYSNLIMTEATGKNCFAIGLGAKSSGTNSFSIGSGGYYTVLGYPMPIFSTNNATGDYSMALGSANNVTNNYSTAFGTGNFSSGRYSMALGYKNSNNGDYSVTVGPRNTATIAASNSTTLGYGLIVHEPRLTAVGSFNDTLSTNLQFVVGNGYPQGTSAIRRNAMVILKSGYVGIGTSTPAYKLDIYNGSLGTLSGKSLPWMRMAGTSSNGDQLCVQHRRFTNGTDWTSAEIRIQKIVDVTNISHISFKSDYLEFGSLYGTNPFMVFRNGSLGIGNSNPGYTLTVNGTAWCSSGSWTGSDLRWKKDIRELTDILPSVLELTPVSYQLRTDEFPELGFTEGRHIGLIAQEVEKVFPQIVNTDNNGFKGIAYDKLSALLVQALKEQQQQIESEKQKNLKLETELESLRERLNAIELLLSENK